MKKKATISEIAREAGVSTCTVSRVLNDKGSGKVSAKVKERIEEIIRKHHYQPAVTARNLATGKSGLIGVQVLSIETPTHVSKVVNTIELQALKRGYNIVLGVSDWSSERERKSIEIMLEKGVEGIIWIFNGTEPTLELRERIIDYGKPLVYLWKEWDESNYAVNDQVRGGFLGTKYLLKLQKRNIAFLSPEIKDNLHSRNRALGYSKALDEQNLSANFIDVKDYSFETGYQTANKIIKRNDDVDAIFATSDVLALGVMKAIKENSLKVGKDIAVLGFDSYDFSSMIDIPLTTISFDYQTLGKRASENLFRLIDGKAAKSIKLPPEIVVRKSCGE